MNWMDIIKYFLVFFIWGIIFIVWYMMRNNNFWKDKCIPYVKPKPIFGNVFNIFTGKIHFGVFLRNICEKYQDPLVGIFLCDEPSLVINDVDLLRNIIVRDFESFSDKCMSTNENVDPVSANTLFFSKTSFWKEEKRKVSYIYSPVKIKAQLDRSSTVTNQMIDYLKLKVLNGENSFLGKNLGDIYSIGTISTVFFGLENNCFKNENAPFMVMFGRILDFTVMWHALQAMCIFIAPTLYKRFRMKFVDSFCEEIFRAITWQLILKREESGRKFNDFIDFLVERKKQEGIVDPGPEANILVGHSAQVFLAGFETSGTTIAFTMYELAKHPEYQRLAREDVLEAIEKHGGLSYASVDSMNYLKKCIKETLRLHPALPFLDRRCTKDYKVPGTDLILRKGQSIFVPIMGIHYDPKYYPDPERFDPERFSPENIEGRPDLAYLPFGAGPRACLGKRFGSLNSTMALAGILSNFYIEFPDGKPYDIEYSMGFMLQDKKKVPLKLVEIEKKT